MKALVCIGFAILFAASCGRNQTMGNQLLKKKVFLADPLKINGVFISCVCILTGPVSVEAIQLMSYHESFVTKNNSPRYLQSQPDTWLMAKTEYISRWPGFAMSHFLIAGSFK